MTGDFRHPGGGGLCMSAGHHRVDEDAVVRPEGMPAPGARSINMSRLAAALTGEADPPITSLVVFNANPAATVPDQTRAHEGLRREDLFTTVLEQRWTDTCDFADVVLPATMQPEHLDLHSSYGHHYTDAQRAGGRPRRARRCRTPRSSAASPPPWGSTTRACATATRTSCASCWTAPASRYEELRETTYARLTGVERGTAPFAEGGFPTPTRPRPHRSTRSSRAAASTRWSATRRRSRRADAELAERFPLVLVAPAGRFFMNSTFASLPWHVGKHGPAAACTCTPTTRRRAAWSTASPVRVHNDRGSFLAAVRGRRRDPAGPRVHLQGLLGAAEPRPAATSTP